MTSRPFLSDGRYREYRPCELLRPYILCYWTMEDEVTPDKSGSEANTPVLVIPDTCADIIIRINHTRQEISGFRISPFFQFPASAVMRSAVLPYGSIFGAQDCF